MNTLLDTIEYLDDGYGAHINQLLTELDAPKADIEETLHAALMNGLCYQASKDQYRVTPNRC